MSADNPFAAPRAGPPSRRPSGDGTTDLGRVTLRNILHLMGINLLVSALVTVGLLMCVLPGLYAGPLLGWGVYRWILGRLRGEDTTLQTVFDPLSTDSGRRWTSYVVVALVIGFAVGIVQVATGLAETIATEALSLGAAETTMTFGLLGFIVDSVWAILVLAYMGAAYVSLVDRECGGLEALGAATRAAYANPILALEMGATAAASGIVASALLLPLEAIEPEQLASALEGQDPTLLGLFILGFLAVGFVAFVLGSVLIFYTVAFADELLSSAEAEP